ncbi:SDR family NAD(P)-dependent oxidoreductase, partial [Vibrio campbellii]
GQDGYTVVLNGIENEKGEKCVAELVEAGIEAEYRGFDVTDEHAVTENINAVGEKYGKIDVVVNNAGGLGGRSPIEGMET